MPQAFNPDADGLNAICQIPEVLLERPEETIITPHPGEMARLLNTQHCGGTE